MAETTSSAEPLYQVKLLAALRNGDPAVIHPFLAEISKDKRNSGDGSGIDTAAAALHLAVRCGSVQTVSLLLQHRAISPNGIHPPGSGTTPLHLAASLGRVDVVNLLLEQDNIDDTIRDAQGKTCREVARNKDVVRAIDDSRAFLNASYRSLLRSYILSPSGSSAPPALIQLLESPRARFIDLSYLDDDSGTSLLHEAARRKDLRLIELAVRAGADVFVRNRKGKMAYDGAHKDDKVRVFLRQFANHDKTLINNSAPLTEPPTLRGYLNKYTNVARGYNTRWFVLKNGVLSYYRHQDDETIASRGTISMKNAVLVVGERSRFEVHSLPTRGHGTVQKWYMKANHPVEAHRWAEAIKNNIEWYRQREGATDSDTSSINASVRRRSGESDQSGVRSTPSMNSQSRSSAMWKKGANPANVSTSSSHDASVQDGHAGPSTESRHTHEADEDGYDEEDSSSSNSDHKAPHANIELHGNAALAQLELTTELARNFSLPPNAPKATADAYEAIKDSLHSTQTLVNEYLHMSREREEWWTRQLKKERARQKFWEESLAVVVKEGETLEKELRARSRRRGSRVFGPSAVSTLTGGTEKKRRPSVLGLDASSPPSRLVPPLLEEPPSPAAATPPPPTAAVNTPKYSPPPPIPSFAVSPPTAHGKESFFPAFAGRSPTRSDTLDTVGTNDTLTATRPARQLSAGDEYEQDTDEEDEFFDAIESNNLPNLIVPESIASPTSVTFSPPSTAPGEKATFSELMSLATIKGPLPKTVDVLPYAGYAHLRERLALRSDQRPSTSLWSVLKHSIGKDLTKISFPVFFNEPTSMLQRMAEDMEFSECLDVAAQEQDPLRRIAFIAAFAMSNYSSTIGRIAKPFNPMLSETFEYVRLDRQYRYVSEQVSHHPPISACWAESPSWHYYGEVDAQNKFMGKSFEIRPTGVAHADLLIPEELGPGYPKAEGDGGKGKVVEHYSWKKVTTNVSGFILGSPTIDHYGDMVVTNHRTGDQCILTFKPRGWRGKDAYEISGQVIAADGRVAYDIAGRWNSQLVAKQVGVGHGQLHPDISVSGPNSPSVAPEYILLWRNSEKPSGSPFNLTPFAITLNDCPQDTLKPFVCPTDCRLRPDQRAFELGKYEEANELKTAQEEKQRSIRKAREEGKMPPHRPRWFYADTDGDTGERVWTPVRVSGNKLEYWAERERVWKEGGNKPWKDVDNIFIEEPPFLKELLAKTA